MGWGKVTLGEVCHIEKGNIGIMKAIHGDYPLVVLGEERRTHNEFQFNGDAVVIPLVSSTGHGDRSMKRIHFQRGKFSVGSILCAVLPKDSSALSAEFLYRYLDLNKEQELVSRMKGMANVSLSIKSIAEIEIPIPPIETQREIITKFDSLETSIRTLFSEHSRQLTLIKELRNHILQDAIHGRLVSQDLNDEPASKLLDRIKTEKEKLVRERKIKKEKPLPEIRLEEFSFGIPDNWVWCRLGDVCVVEMGQSPDGETYNELGNGFPLVNGPVEFGGKNPFDKTVKSKYTTSPTKLCKEGDLLICVRGSTTGRTNIAAFDACIGRGVAAIRPISYEVYIHYFIAFQREDIFNLGRGSTFPNISQENLTHLVLPLPPLSEQHRIVYKIDRLLKLCDELERSIQQNQKYTQELLQVALKEALNQRTN